MKIVTANLNGIRATAKRRGLEWLTAQDADVYCFQEVRATEEQLHAELAASGLAGFHVTHSAASQLGRSGVAILTREAPVGVRVGGPAGAEEFDEEGRWVEVDVETARGPLAIASVYVHTGEAETPKQEQKYRFLDAMTARLKELASVDAVVCGDLNVAHREVDLKNWKGNRKKAGFLEPERAYFDGWFDDLGWVDVGRANAGEGPGPYTWWSWRGKAFDNDSGWRIDYQLASASVAPTATAVEVGRAASYDERWSDHAAVTVTYAV